MSTTPSPTTSAQASTRSPTACVNGALSSQYNAGGSFTCDIRRVIYGEADCVVQEIAEQCCHCGGGVSTTPSPTTSAQVSSAVCVDGVLSEEWSSGIEWTSTCVAVATMEITLSVTATAEGKEKMCHKTNLAQSGATFQSFVHALYTAGVATSSATFTLSCTDRRLASNNTRRLQDEFKLAASARFADEKTASTFSEKVTELSPGIASEFESQVSTSIGVNITAAISFLELTVESEDSTASACRSFPVLTLTFLFAFFFFKLPLSFRRLPVSSALVSLSEVFSEDARRQRHVWCRSFMRRCFFVRDGRVPRVPYFFKSPSAS